MSALDINEYVTDVVDSRGRVNVSTDHAGSVVTYVVLDPDTLTRIGGPNTKSVQSDGRLSIGSDYTDEEVTVGIVSAKE